MIINKGKYGVGWSIPLASYNESHLVDIINSTVQI